MRTYGLLSVVLLVLLVTLPCLGRGFRSHVLSCGCYSGRLWCYSWCYSPPVSSFSLATPATLSASSVKRQNLPTIWPLCRFWNPTRPRSPFVSSQPRRSEER